MYLLEIALVIVLLTQIVTQNVRGLSRNLSLASFAMGLFIILLSILLGEARWQMTPAYLLFFILSLLLLRRAHSHVVVRSVGVLFGVLLLGISVTLSLALPIVTLAAPNGPYMVGSRSFSLLDESRNESFFGVPDERRELYIQIWYPGVIADAQPPPRVRTLWEEAYRGPWDPAKFFMGYMQGVETHTYQDIPLSTADSSYPVIVFSHGLALLAEQNTPLMEHLASHGYVVVGIGHTRVSARVISSQGKVIPVDFGKITEALAELRPLNREFNQRAARASSPEERGALSLGLGEQAIKMNALMEIWEEDLRFVLDVIADPAKGNPDFSRFLDRVDARRIGMLGMSFGGGAITEICKIDIRCRAGLNIDGGVYGQHQREPLKTPFLSIISPANKKHNELLIRASESDYYEVAVEGAAHGDLLDMSFLMPFMKWLNLNGTIDAERAIDILNAVSLRFFDAYLRDGAKPRFDVQEFPDIHVEMNSYARGNL